MFSEEMELYFESRFDGTFTNGDGDVDHSRVDYTQHCICALMKVESLLFRDTLGASGYYSYHVVASLSAQSVFLTFFVFPFFPVFVLCD